MLFAEALAVGFILISRNSSHLKEDLVCHMLYNLLFVICYLKEIACKHM
jgi:hypothetical protein